MPVLAATPLPVTGRKWKADHVEDYRQAIREAVAGAGPGFHLLEGPDLLPAEPELLADGLHPNDAGFEVLARNMESACRNIFTRKGD